MWAVLLGVILVLAAATSSHAAVIKQVAAPTASQSRQLHPQTARLTLSRG